VKPVGVVATPMTESEVKPVVVVSTAETEKKQSAETEKRQECELMSDDWFHYSQVSSRREGKEKRWNGHPEMDKIRKACPKVIGALLLVETTIAFGTFGPDSQKQKYSQFGHVYHVSITRNNFYYYGSWCADVLVRFSDPNEALKALKSIERMKMEEDRKVMTIREVTILYGDAEDQVWQDIWNTMLASRHRSVHGKRKKGKKGKRVNNNRKRSLDDDDNDNDFIAATKLHKKLESRDVGDAKKTKKAVANVEDKKNKDVVYVAEKKYKKEEEDTEKKKDQE